MWEWKGGSGVWRGWWEWMVTYPLVLLAWHGRGWSHLPQGPSQPKAFVTVNDVMGFVKGLCVLIYLWMCADKLYGCMPKLPSSEHEITSLYVHCAVMCWLWMNSFKFVSAFLFSLFLHLFMLLITLWVRYCSSISSFNRSIICKPNLFRSVT